MEYTKPNRILRYGLLSAALAGLTLLSGGCGINTAGEPFRMPEEPERPNNRNPNNPNRDPFSQGRRLQVITTESTDDIRTHSPRLPRYPESGKAIVVELYSKEF